MILPVTRDKLINEINLLPEDKLTEVYNFIHYFRLGTEKTKQNKDNILSFSGAWENMNDEYLSDISERRSNTFSSRFKRNATL